MGPAAAGSDGAHSKAELPNTIDPLGGWTDTGETYQEDNCIERQRYVKQITSQQPYQLHHTTSKGWGYMYIVELNPAGVVAGQGQLPLAELTITDEHSGEDCGPVLVDYPRGCSHVNCDRDYTLGDAYTTFLSGLNHPYMIQDAHDPNDLIYQHNRFTALHVPMGHTAIAYAMVPVEGANGAQCGHSNTEAEYPNALDPQRGWVDTQRAFIEDNGIKRRIFTKQLPAGDTTLYHQTTVGLVYMNFVQFICTAS
jgi:hypothetical protein